MTLQELKEKIESKSANDLPLIVFVCKDNKFIAHQYIKQLSVNLNEDISYVETLQDLLRPSTFLSEELIKVFDTDSLDLESLQQSKVNNAFIITKATKGKSSVDVITVPSLENWQVEDYLKTNCRGISSEAVKSICSGLNYDIYAVDNALSKLHIFDEKDRQRVYEELHRAGEYEKKLKEAGFDFTNAITTNNKQAFVKELKRAEMVDPIWMIAVLYQSFRKVILVQLGKNPTPESTGMSQKQFNAMKYYNCYKYSNDKLKEIFEMLTKVDSMIKTGYLPAEIATDYIVTKIFDR